jgi:hypothetical protein
MKSRIEGTVTMLRSSAIPYFQLSVLGGNSYLTLFTVEKFLMTAVRGCARDHLTLPTVRQAGRSIISRTAQMTTGLAPHPELDGRLGNMENARLSSRKGFRQWFHPLCSFNSTES